jgi:hypothetical protein
MNKPDKPVNLATGATSGKRESIIETEFEVLSEAPGGLHEA